MKSVKIFPQINQEISGAHIGSVAVWKAEAENEGSRKFHNIQESVQTEPPVPYGW